MSKPALKSVPAAALRFTGQVRFGQFSAAADPAKPAEPVPFDLCLLSGQVIDHPYWGPCLHDVAGMSAHKDTFPLDYCHDSGELIGDFSAIDTSSGGLQAKGRIVPFKPDDRASEVLHRAAAGTPYEASVQFDPCNCGVEQLDDGQQATVNGQAVQGPLTIFRQWELRGGALCPQGRDKYAHASFSAGDAGDATFTIRTLEHSPMVESATPTAASETVSAPAGFWSALAAMLSLRPKNDAIVIEAPSASPPVPAVAASATVPAAAGTLAAGATAGLPSSVLTRAEEAKQFTTTFGETQGALYFAQGLTMAESQTRFAAALREENEQLKKRLGGAALAGATTTPAGTLSLGEEKPLSSEVAGEDSSNPAATALQARFGKGLGAFMAGCCPPKK